jgi:hypothetical protein
MVRKLKAAKRPPAAVSAPKTAARISTWECDPGSGPNPTGGAPVDRPAPDISRPPLACSIAQTGRAPPPAVYPAGSPEFRYWVAADALRRSSDYWGALLGQRTRWQFGATLPVELDYGSDLNAYYDRVGLKFFRAGVGGRTVHTGESPDVVCHEVGHAVLDAIRPQLWDVASIEAAAFHESFGDLSAILSALQLESVRHRLIAETAGAVYRTSSLSRIAEQLGWAIRQSHPSVVEPDCLRNAVNAFSYTNPAMLPSDAPASSLSTESHSFSRVFTSAAFDGLASIYRMQIAQDQARLKQASLNFGAILVEAVRAAPITPAYFSQVAAHMVRVGDARFGADCAAALKSAFVKHGVLSPTSAALVTRTMAAVAASAPAKTLKASQIDVGDLDLGVPTITVMAPGEAPSFMVMGAAPLAEATVRRTEGDDARAFIEDLVRRGRLVGRTQRRASTAVPAGVAYPDRRTHELRREQDNWVLRRLRIACWGHHGE